MRILLTGGGTGGHIFPLLSLIEELGRREENFEIKFIGPRTIFEQEFKKAGVKVERIVSAKLRRYFSLVNILDFFKFFISLFQALFKLYFYMPDIVFSKGGPSSLSVVLAARFYFIPIFIHESDSVPGLSNRLASKYAKKIFISFENSRKYFSKEKVFLVGNPIRKTLLLNIPSRQEAKEQLGFNKETPLILVLGGSQGAQILNQFIVANLPEILKITQIVHQTGPLNYDRCKKEANFILQKSYLKQGYKIFSFIDKENLKLSLAACDLVVSRAGSGAIFEIAAFGKPSILIPLKIAASDHQRFNALEYNEKGATFIIEEQNLKPGLFLFNLNKVLNNQELRQKMGQAAKEFSKPHAAENIVDEILNEYRKPRLSNNKRGLIFSFYNLF